MVGSVVTLLRELDRLSEFLEIPSNFTHASEELWEASDSPTPDGAPWQRYGRESFGCVALQEACREAVRWNAAVVFT